MERLEPGGVTRVRRHATTRTPTRRARRVRVLAGLHGHARRVLVLGDMLELGERAAGAAPRASARGAARAGIDLFVLVGELRARPPPAALEAGARPADRVVHLVRRAAPREAALAEVLPCATGDVVLVKGSRRMGLERWSTRSARAARAARGTSGRSRGR